MSFPLQLEVLEHRLNAIQDTLNQKDIYAAILAFTQFGEFFRRHFSGQKINEMVFHLRNIFISSKIVFTLNPDALGNIAAIFERSLWIDPNQDKTVTALQVGVQCFVMLGKVKNPYFAQQLVSPVDDNNFKAINKFISEDLVPNTPQRLQVEARIDKMRTLPERADETVEQKKNRIVTADNLQTEANNYFALSRKTKVDTHRFKSLSRKIAEEAEPGLSNRVKRVLHDVLSAISQVVTMGVETIEKIGNKINYGWRAYNARPPVPPVDVRFRM